METKPEQIPKTKSVENKEGNGLSQEEYYKILKPLRTYERDLAEHVRNTQASKTEVNLKEHKRKRERKKEKVEKSRNSNGKIRNLAIFILIVLIIISTGGLIYSLLNSTSKETLTEASPIKIATFFRTDMERTIEVTGYNKDNMAYSLENAIQQEEIATRKITIFHLMDSTSEQKLELKPRKFLEIIEADAPLFLLRSLGNEMDFGIFALEKFSPVMVFEIRDFNNAFAGMLQWEKNIGIDLQGWISGSEFSEGSFSDLSSKGKDLRVLRNSKGKIILLYSFLDKKTLLITDRLDTFKETLKRF